LEPAIARRLDEPQDTKVQATLDDILHTLGQLRPAKRLPWYGWPATVVLAGLLGLGLGWYTVGCPYDVKVQAGLMSQMDALLVERYGALPPALQTAVVGLYTQLGLQPPGERKGGKR